MHAESRPATSARTQQLGLSSSGAEPSLVSWDTVYMASASSAAAASFDETSPASMLPPLLLVDVQLRS